MPRVARALSRVCKGEGHGECGKRRFGQAERSFSCDNGVWTSSTGSLGSEREGWGAELNRRVSRALCAEPEEERSVGGSKEEEQAVCGAWWKSWFVVVIPGIFASEDTREGEDVPTGHERRSVRHFAAIRPERAGLPGRHRRKVFPIFLFSGFFICASLSVEGLVFK